MNVSPRTLNILAAVVWYIGATVLLIKSGSLLAEAGQLHPNPWGPTTAGLTGVLIGGLKARYLFSKSCQKNLKRIAGLNNPRLWQFFRPKFFIMLVLMIGAGVLLSRLAHHNYAFLWAVAALDLSIATALLGSSYVFWQEKAFIKRSFSGSLKFDLE